MCDVPEPSLHEPQPSEPIRHAGKLNIEIDFSQIPDPAADWEAFESTFMGKVRDILDLGIIEGRVPCPAARRNEAEERFQAKIDAIPKAPWQHGIPDFADGTNARHPQAAQDAFKKALGVK